MRLKHVLKLGLLACLCLSLTRCNVFEGFAEEAETVEALSEEAEILLAKGQAPEAVKKLEAALQKEPANKKVKVQLAIATMEANDINASDLLSLSNTLNDIAAGTTGGSQAAPLAPMDHLQCTPAEAHDRGTVFTPLTINIFQEMQQQLPVYQRINDLLDDVLPPLTESTTYFQVRMALINAGIAEGQANQYTKAALLAQALTKLGDAIVSTFTIPGVTYKKLTSGSSGFFYGFCATDAGFANMCTKLTGAGGTFDLAEEAINALSIRSQEFNQNGNEDQIVTEAREALAKVRDEVAC